MKKLLFLLLLPIAINSYGQLSAFENEVQNKDGVIYYQNRPLTGKLFSNDATAIKNDCECTLEADYKNGKLHGIKKMYYPNGKLKFKGDFSDGKPIGKHIFLDDKSNVIKQQEYASDGSYTETVYNENGEKIGEGFFDVATGEKTVKFFKDEESVKEENYKNEKLIQVTYWNEGKKVKEEMFTYGTQPLRIVKLFDENEIPVAQESYDVTTGKKHGIWLQFDETGNKTQETEYRDDIIYTQQSYKDNQKHGKGFEIDPFTHNKVEVFYRNGKLVDSQEQNPDFYIENYLAKHYHNSYIKPVVVYRFNPIINTNEIYIIETTDEDSKTIEQNIRKIVEQQMLKRPNILPNDIDAGNKILSGIFKIENIRHELKKHTYEWHKNVKGKSVKYKEWGYNAVIAFDIKYLTPENNVKKTLHFTSTGGLYSILAIALRGKMYTQDAKEAYEFALSGINIKDFHAMAFPAISKIVKVLKKNSRGVKYVLIEDGSANFVNKGAVFKIYDEDNSSFKSGIRIKKSKAYEAEGKVTDNKKWLEKYIQEHKDVFIKESSYY